MSPSMIVCEWLSGLTVGTKWALVFLLLAAFTAYCGMFGATLGCLVFAGIWHFAVSDNYDED